MGWLQRRSIKSWGRFVQVCLACCFRSPEKRIYQILRFKTMRKNRQLVISFLPYQDEKDKKLKYVTRKEKDKKKGKKSLQILPFESNCLLPFLWLKSKTSLKTRVL